ncbi:MAG TPA: zf-HC2 domain-containing protein [Thermoanaerobaculaceae bacterium]|nr:zf-HC2 domain-containing protein [Thermoanaerobaculaceae bacterium]
MSDHTHPRLDALLDGELGPAEAARVETHAAGCERCRLALAEARALGERLTEPVPSLPAGFAAWARRRALARRWPEPPLWWLGVPVAWRAGLAALLLLAALAGARIGAALASDRFVASDLAAALDAPAADAITTAAGTGEVR